MSFRRLLVGSVSLSLALAGAVALTDGNASASTTGSTAASAAPAPQPAAAAITPTPTVTPTPTLTPTPTPTPGPTNIGRGPDNYVMTPGTYFSFPNRSAADRQRIRARVIRTINSTWGGPHNSLGEPSKYNGMIRLATWSFTDWTVAKALVRAHKRGATVQIIAATLRNADDPAWAYLRRNLGTALYKPGHPETALKHSWARQCHGACRGSGGTPHAKYFLFDNVGAGHHHDVVMSTSMNLTTFAYQGQWNQAQVIWNHDVWMNFSQMFNQMRWNHPASPAYRVFPESSTLTSFFFPAPGMHSTTDPVMRALNQVDPSCRSRTANGTTFRTRIRIIQYAIYDTRGTWIAKKLRSLWNRGCDIKIIYSISTRPVVAILRSHTGRGPIPMKQSVITNSKGEIVKYNHSKWMTITGNYAGKSYNYMFFSGSANWSNAAFSNDEQMTQQISVHAVQAASANFSTTWAQGSSHAPGYGQKPTEGRVMARATHGQGGYATGDTIPWGTGAYKLLGPNG